jgi:hypothetical protein
MCGLMYHFEMHYVLGLLLSQVYCCAVVSKCIGLAMEEVPEKWCPFEATIDLAVTTSFILGCLLSSVLQVLISLICQLVC